MAGVNAALACLARPALHFNRYDSYIGVMVNDLITNTRDEPYRVFSARSENRLFLREDNTVLRMAAYRKNLFLNNALDSYQQSFLEDVITSYSIHYTKLYERMQGI